MRKLNQDVDWEHPYTWLDSEIRDVLGIDLFKAQFDTSSGYGIISGENADVLLIKLERLSECCEQAFAEFMGIDNFTLVSSNVATNKYYSDAYRKILGRFNVPGERLDNWYSSDQVRHFYDKDEIRGFMERWARRSSA